MLAQADLEALPPIARLLAHKNILREAAKGARNELLETKPDSFQAMQLTFATIARAIAFSDYDLAKLLVSRSSLANERISIGKERITLTDPVKFEKLVRWRREKGDLQENE